MKVLIVGGVAGGATTATRLRRLDEKAQIIIFERGAYVSFANCGLPYYIGDVIKEKKNLLLQTPKSFKDRFNIDVRIKNEVIKINRDKKEVLVRNLEDGGEYIETYDKLVLSPGAEPINPFKELNSNKISTLRNVDDSVKIKEYIEENNPKNVVIIGGGYIGVEMAENIKHRDGINVTIVEKAPHLIAPLDSDIASIVHNKLRDNDIDIILNNGVKEIKENDKIFKIILDNGEIEADYIILAIGVRPETKIAKEAGITLNSKESIIVDDSMQTNDKDIYALGDAIEIKNYITKMPDYIPLAGPANRQARIVANNICGMDSKYNGTMGSSILKLFDYNLAMTGLNERVCKLQNIDYKKIIITPFSHATYYPGANEMIVKVIYLPKEKVLLGAQVVGKDGVDKVADILATAIRSKLSIYALEDLELCYAPPFSSAKSVVNVIGNVIENELNGLVENVSWEDVEKIDNPYVLDVRTPKEYSFGCFDNAINIPVDELRDNMSKLNKEKVIYVYCKTGVRSYISCRILMQNGYKVKNIMGGYNLYKQIKEDRLSIEICD